MFLSLTCTSGWPRPPSVCATWMFPWYVIAESSLTFEIVSVANRTFDNNSSGILKYCAKFKTLLLYFHTNVILTNILLFIYFNKMIISANLPLHIISSHQCFINWRIYDSLTILLQLSICDITCTTFSELWFYIYNIFWFMVLHVQRCLKNKAYNAVFLLIEKAKILNSEHFI